MRKKKYEYLKEQYSEYVNLNQLYQICRISKRSARYLLKNGIIPCTENDSKTWRYKIALDDVITYLHRREQSGSLIPKGAVNNKNKYTYPRKKRLPVPMGSESELKAYFSSIFAGYPDVLTTLDVADMTGITKYTIRKYIRTNVLRAISSSNIYLIPKDNLIEFVATPRYTQCKSSSDTFRKIIGGFELWKTAK